MKPIPIAACVALLAGSGMTQAWSLLDSANTPGRRRGTSPAYCPAIQKVIVVGGMKNLTPYAQSTWAFDGSKWAPLTVTDGPSPKASGRMVYDKGRNRLVWYGIDYTPQACSGCLWEFDGTEWIKALAQPPLALSYYLGPVYHEARGTVIGFGGWTAWEYDGTTWRSHPAPTITPYISGPLAYDPVSKKIIMWAPYPPGVITAGTTWEWDNGAWSQIPVVHNLPFLGSQLMYFDPTVGTLVLDGVHDVNGTSTYVRYGYTGTAWGFLGTATAPGLRLGHRPVLDPVRGRLIDYCGWELPDGTDEYTWELVGNQWQIIPTTKMPPPIRHSKVAGDGTSQAIVLFGIGQLPYGSATWAFSGGRWIDKTSTFSPSLRFGHGMAFDTSRGQAVLFGGRQSGGNQQQLGDTWEFNGSFWVSRSPLNSPPATSHHVLAYDAARKVVVLFGGSTATGLVDTTWEYDGATWSPVNIWPRPQARYSAGMAYDTARGKIVLFGGWAFAAGSLQDTWEYDGTAWVQVAAPTAPEPRSGHSMCYDHSRKRIVLHGGRESGSNGQVFGDTWEYDGTDWHLLADGAPAVYSHVLFEGPAGTGIFLQGGNDVPSSYGDRKTWRFDSSALPSWIPFGAGCPGSAGTPHLALTAGTVPSIGGTLSLTLGNLPAAPGLVYLVTGFSKTTWNGVTLPLDLTALGIAGCTAYVAPDPTLSTFLVHGGTNLTWSLPIPFDPSLAGTAFYNQALVLDAQAPNGIASLSNAGEGTVN